MAKKKSIREFVSEPSLKFQIYLLKYSKHLKELKEKNPQEIQEKFIKDTDKKIKSWEEKECNPLTAERNISYLKSLKPFDNEEYIKSEFEKCREEYVYYLKKEIKEHNKKVDKELLEYAQTIELTENVSKEKFGQMLLLIIKNLANMPSFIGYTENWKTDFYSNAIEKTLLYLDNFDENILSKRTGKKSNAFAYITQICFNAFVNIINIRKAESGFLSKQISFESSVLDGVRSMNDLNELKIEAYQPDENIIYVEVSSVEEAIKEIQNAINVNFIIDKNKEIKAEIETTERTTSEEDKITHKKEYESYIQSLKSQIKEVGNHIDGVFLIRKGVNTKDILDEIENIGLRTTELSISIGESGKEYQQSTKIEKEPTIEDAYEEW